MRFTFLKNKNALVLVAASIVLSAITGTGGPGLISAHPTDEVLIESIAARHILEGRVETKSACRYFSDPKNCVRTICSCADGRFYALNREAMRRGEHGCDPPKDMYPGGPCTLKASCCPVPTYYGTEDDNPVLT